MQRLMWFFEHLEEVLGAFLMAAMLTAVTASVFFRYVLNAPFAWTEEVALGLFVWMVFIGSAAVIKHGGHVAVDVVIVLFSQRVQRILLIVGDVIVIVVLVGMAWLGWLYALSGLDVYTLALKIPMFWVYLAIPVGSVLMIWRTIQQLVAAFEAPRAQVNPLEEVKEPL
jgi:C4-dicarboxylate transporter DctQ subunit